MFDFPQHLREATLRAASDLPPVRKAEMLNMLEAIIEGELSPEQIVDALDKDTLPVRYVVKEAARA